MSAEPETTLAWAEFLWRVVREAPEAATLYITLFLLWRRTRTQKGRIICLELWDSVAISDSLTVTSGPQRVIVGTAGEADTALPLRVTKRVTIGPAIEHCIALPIRAVGGAQS